MYSLRTASSLFSILCFPCLCFRAWQKEMVFLVASAVKLWYPTSAKGTHVHWYGMLETGIFSPFLAVILFTGPLLWSCSSKTVSCFPDDRRASWSLVLEFNRFLNIAKWQCRADFFNFQAFFFLFQRIPGYICYNRSRYSCDSANRANWGPYYQQSLLFILPGTCLDRSSN